jgi:hypothetical protein
VWRRARYSLVATNGFSRQSFRYFPVFPAMENSGATASFRVLRFHDGAAIYPGKDYVRETKELPFKEMPKLRDSYL